MLSFLPVIVPPMFELSVDREFCAAHAIMLIGRREPVHGHNWRVRVTLNGPVLNADGILCDFHMLEKRVDEILRPFHNNDLNEIPPFDELNPTTEHIAKYIAEQTVMNLPATISGVRVTVTEAPGCRAGYSIEI